MILSNLVVFFLVFWFKYINKLTSKIINCMLYSWRGRVPKSSNVYMSKTFLLHQEHNERGRRGEDSWIGEEGWFF
jgi:hypothetical protein